MIRRPAPLTAASRDATRPRYATLSAGAAHRQRGVALALVLIALAMAVVLSLTFLSASTTSTAMANNMRGLHQARAVAESGMALTLAHLKAAGDWREAAAEGRWVAAQAAPGGTFDVFLYDGFDEDGDGTIDSDGDLNDDAEDAVTVVVVGKSGGVSHRVEARVYPGKSSGLHLVLLAGDSPPDDQDAAKKALAQSWGWRVTTLLASTSDAAYSAALADADVVWVSENVQSGDIGDALTGLAIGVVSEEQALNDELQIASSGSNYRASTIEVTDDTHFITSGWGRGRVTLTTADTDLTRLGGGLAGGAQTLAKQAGGSSATLVAVDAGATLTDGSSAAGRRVVLPFGGNDFDITLLTPAGKALLRNALTWAGPASGGINATAHYRLEEASGLRAADSAGVHDGTYVASPTYNAVGISGRAVAFDDSEDRVTVPAEVIDGKGDTTFAVWFRTTITRSQALLSGARGDNHNAELVLLLNATTLRYYYGTGTGDFKSWSIADIADDHWHQLVIVRDRARAEVTAYLDGASLGTRGQTLELVRVEHLVLGEEQESVDGGYDPGQSFVGTLDEAMFFHRALSAEDVAELYAAYDPGGELPQRVALYEFAEPDPVTPNLVGHWKLDEPPHQPIAGGSSWIRLQDNALVLGYDSSHGGSAAPLPARLVTLRTDPASVLLSGNAQLIGHAYAGPGGNPDTAVVVSDPAKLTGRAGAILEPLWVNVPRPPAMTETGTTLILDGGEHTLASDVKAERIVVRNGAKVTISGHRKVWATDAISVESNAQVIIPGGSSLKMYAQNRVDVKTGGRLGTDYFGPGRLSVTVLAGGFYTADNSITCGSVYTLGNLEVAGGAYLVGNAFAAENLVVKGNGRLLIDRHTNTLWTTFADDAADTSHGFYRNGPSTGGAGHAAGRTAAAFDGVDDFMQVPHNDAFMLDAGSLGFWFRANDTESFQVLASKDSQDFDEGGHLTVGLYGNRLVYWVENKAGNDHLLVASGTIAANTWYHCVVTFGPGGQRLYLNGQLRASSDYDGGLGASAGGTGNTEPWTFGVSQRESYPDGSSDHWSYPFAGRIGDVRLYDQNLTADQAADLYADAAPRAVVPPIVEDTSTYGGPLDLRIATPENAVWVGGGGLTVTGDNTITRKDAAAKLHDALTASNAYTVELLFTPTSDSQSGPAELIAYGDNGSARAFTVGQEDRAVVARLQTSATTRDGSPEVETDNLLTQNKPVHLLVAFDGGDHRVRVYRDSKQVLAEERLGSLSTWSDALRLVLANDGSGSNPWHGTFHHVAVWDRAFNIHQAKNVYHGQPPGDGTGPFRAVWIENP